MSFQLNPLLWCCQNPNTLGWKSVWGYTLIKTGSVLCLTSFEFRVHFNVPFNLEMRNFILRKKKTIALIKVFMNKVQRASWTTNDSYKTTLWWVKCKWLRNMQIKFPWKHARASKINGGNSWTMYISDFMLFLLFFVLLILFLFTKHFLGWLHLLWSGCCQAKLSLILVYSGWPTLGISCVPSCTELAFLSTICLSI